MTWEFKRLDRNANPKRVADEVIVGSGGNCGFIVLHPSVSSEHAKLKPQDDGLAVYDLGSPNGTFVNDRQEKAVLLPANTGEKFFVSFGQARFVVHQAQTATHRPSTTMPVSTPPPIPAQGVATPTTPGREKKKYRVKTSSDTPPKIATLLSHTQPEPEQPKPPADPDRIWHYRHAGETFGPLTTAELFQAVDGGKLVKQDDVWKDGMKNPVPGYKVKGLFDEAPKKEVGKPSEGPGMADSGHGEAVCPCCWFKFEPEEAYFVSTHPDLIGDPIQGPDEQLRFLPERFTPEGLAIDAKGMKCTDMACPRCRMRIPSQVLHTQPFFLSIVGAPGSGKSHVLASAIWKLREVMPSRLGYSFQDVDAVTNQWVNQYEESLFFDEDSERLSPIVKTDETAAHVYKEVNVAGMQMFLPIPCMFTFSPRSEPGSENCMVLYDNAGENFQVGKDTVNQPGTQHLVRSQGILFLYDPASDPRMRKYLRTERGVEDLPKQSLQRQDVLLVEMISRIRRHAGLRDGELYDTPLVIGLSKADLFGDLFDFQEPMLVEDAENGGWRLDLKQVADCSFRTREVIRRFAPEMVNTVEAFAQRVLFLPVSALGHNPDEAGIHTDRLQPGWVEVPFLYFLSRAGCLPVQKPDPSETETPVNRVGNLLRFPCPATGIPREIPWQYSGYTLTCAESGQPFEVPVVEGAPQL